MKPMSKTAVALTALIACSCSTPSQTPPRNDAPTKAPATGVPATPGADEETPTPSPEKIRWRDLRIADGCTIRMAENPAAFDLQLDWKPCADGPRGCREISTNLGDDVFSGSRHLRGAMHGGAVTLVALFSLPGPVMQRVLAPLDGAPFFAVEGPQSEDCSLGSVGLSDDGAVVEIAYDNKSGFASRAYLRGPLREDPSWSKVAARLLRSEYPSFIGEAELSVGGRVVVAANGGPLRWLDPATEKWERIPGSKSGWACCFAGHGDFVTFMIESIPERVMAARLGEPAHELRLPVKGGGTSPIAIDGTRAVWLEGQGRDKNNIYERIELWTGEVSEHQKIERARVVTALPLATMARPIFNGGVAVVSLFKQGAISDLAVIRVADAETLLLAPPKGLVNKGIVWVASDEVAVRVGPLKPMVAPAKVRRIPISSLPLLPVSAGEEAK